MTNIKKWLEIVAKRHKCIQFEITEQNLFNYDLLFNI